MAFLFSGGQMGDEEYTKELTEYLHDLFRDRDEEVRENRKARWGKDFTTADVPEAYQASTQLVVLPRNQDVLQRMASLITNDEPAINVPPPSQTDKDRRRANKLERGLAGILRKTAQDSGRDAWRYAADAALADGCGVLKTWYAPDAWSDEPKLDPNASTKDKDAYLAQLEDYRKAAHFPIPLTDVDLVTYYPVRTGSGTTEVLEICSRAIVPTLRSLGLKAIEKSGGKLAFRKLRKGEPFPVNGGLSTGSGQKREITERWDGQAVYYYSDGVKMDERPAPYGRPPYFELAGYTTSSRDPDKATRSAIAGQRSLVKSLNRWLTIMSNLGYLNGFPYLVEGDESMAGVLPNQTTVQQIVPGSVLARGTKFLEVPGVSKDVQNMISLLQAEADRSALASVMYGAGSGTSSGYQVASLQAAAQSVLKPVIRNIATGLADLFSFWLRLIDQRIFNGDQGSDGANDRSKVYVWGRGEKKGQQTWLDLGPADIRGYYVVNVELRPLLPMDEIAQRDSAIRMHESRLWPARYALEKTGEEQPEDLLEELAVEDYMRLPEIAMRIATDAAKRAGLIEPPPPALPGPAGGSIMPGQGPSALGGVGGPGMPSAGPVQVPVPGAGTPLVPPGPAGVGGPPQGVQRAPGGNFGPEVPVP